MQKNYPISNQEKIIGVNSRFGNPGIAKQQGTTVEIYDTLPLPTAGGSNVVLDFFIDAKTRSFPFTNLKDGKLPPQEAFVANRIYFYVVKEVISTGKKTMFPLFANDTSLGSLLNNAGIDGLGEVEISISNNRVLKPIPLTSFAPNFNAGDDSQNNVLQLDTQLVFPPQLEFKLSLKLSSANAAPEDTQIYIAAVMGGVGAIFSPKSNF